MRQWLRDKTKRFNDFFDESTVDGEERVNTIRMISIMGLLCLVVLFVSWRAGISQKQKVHTFQTQYSWEICTPAVQDSSGQYHVLIKQVSDDGATIVRKANFSQDDFRRGIVNVQFSKGSGKIVIESTKYRLVWQVPKPQIKTQAKTKPKSES